MLSNKKLKSFNSFEEMDLDRARNAASVDPIQALRETVELILRAYGTSRKELKMRPRHNRITFTKSE